MRGFIQTKTMLVRFAMVGLSLVLALSTMGIGFAMNTGGITLNGLAVGPLDPQFAWAESNDDGTVRPGFDIDDTAAEDPSEPQIAGIACSRFTDYDIAGTKITANDGNSLEISVTNAYPGYCPTVFFGIYHNQAGEGIINGLTVTASDGLTVTKTGIANGTALAPGSTSLGSISIAVGDVPQDAVLSVEVKIPIDFTDRTVVLMPIQDSSTDKNAPDANHGGDSYLEVQKLAGAQYRCWSLMQFGLPDDLTGSGKTVSSAKLRLWVEYFNSETGATQPVVATRITGDWDENTVNWNNQPSSGGTPVEIEIGGTGYWAEWDVTADVQLFADNPPANNYGWYINHETAAKVTTRFSSSEGSHPPQLNIIYK